MLTINQLTMEYGGRVLFEDAQLNLIEPRRYGVVGANGSGKSTFLRVLAGAESSSNGTIGFAKDTTIGLLKQDHFSYEQDRVVDVVIRGKALLWSALEEKKALLKFTRLSHADNLRLSALEETIAHYDGYSAESYARYLLNGLEIKPEYHDGPLSALSGGYKLRALLAQLLFQAPDIMLLDEPTNHLDIVSIGWLERFLQYEFNGLLLFVSHDRDFLNNLATHILDIDYQSITEYTGNYDQFILNKEQTLALKQKELTHKKKVIDEMQRNVDRFRAKASKARQAASREKMIDRIELPEIKDSSRRAPQFKFTVKTPSGKEVLKVNKLSKSFGSKKVLQQASFNLMRGDRCAIIGPNGVGKSTLLKLVLGQIAPDSGSYEWGYSAITDYFAQDYQHEMLQPVTAMEWLDQAANASEKEIRQTLGQMLFSGDTVHKKVTNLSGGECARLVFGRTMLRQANILILDEPTNHLDLEAIDALADALSRFTGTVLFVSHNRHFVTKLATRVIALTERGMQDFNGSYEEYHQRYGEDYLERLR